MSSPVSYNACNRESRLAGVLVTVIVHIVAWFIFFKVVYLKPAVSPPPLVVEVLLDPEIEPLVVRRRVVPQRESNPAPGGKTVAGTTPEPTAAAEIDEQGDIEKLVEKPVQINTRSLYRSVDNGEIAGNTSGEQENSNAMYSENPGTRTAGSGHDHSVDLSGRTGIGKLPEPVNTSNKEGSVVVEITVNQRGKVMTAKAGAQGTTIQDATLWKAAEQAAMQTSFNIDMKKPVLQQGKITYIFKLK